MESQNLIMEMLNYISQNFGGSGILIAYFIGKDIYNAKKNADKKDNGEWVDLKKLEENINNSIHSLKSCGFSADKFSEVVEKQSSILVQLLYQQKENGGALNRIESKLERNHP